MLLGSKSYHKLVSTSCAHLVPLYAATCCPPWGKHTKKEIECGREEDETYDCRNILSPVQSREVGKENPLHLCRSSHTGLEKLHLPDHTVEMKTQFCAGFYVLKLSLPFLLKPLREATVQHPGVYAPSSILFGGWENDHSQGLRSLLRGAFYVNYLHTVA